METYLNQLGSSAIPLPHWAVGGVWLILYTLAHVLFRKAMALSNRQNFIVSGGPPGLVKEPTWELTGVQIAFACAIFAYGLSVGGRVFTFFVGGWVVVSAVSIPTSLRSILFYRALADPGAAT